MLPVARGKLRLRAYKNAESVARGAVKKNGKKYKGLPSAPLAAIAPQNGIRTPPQ